MEFENILVFMCRHMSGGEHVMFAKVLILYKLIFDYFLVPEISKIHGKCVMSKL